MILRFLLTLTFTVGFGAKATACSCAPWEGGYVSDFSKQYLSAWAVPVSGEMETIQNQWGFDEVVKYDLEIIDSFNFVMQTSIKVISSVEDGASCGKQLDIGTPQFLTLHSRAKDGYFLSNCAPRLPYLAVKAYLQNGEDSFIQSMDRCFNENAELSKSDPDCKVWEGSASESHRHGNKDWLKYVILWRAEQKSRAIIPTP